MKVGDTFKSKDGLQEVEIDNYDSLTGKFRFIHRDPNGVMVQWDDPEDIQMLVDLLDLLTIGELTKDIPKHCWHNHKEKKWLLITFYWICKDCGKELEDE